MISFESLHPGFASSPVNKRTYLSTLAGNTASMSQPEPGPMPSELVIATSRNSRQLVLCFDGTGNAFTGSNSDTNVVKLLSKLDRNDPDQFHYYQS